MSKYRNVLLLVASFVFRSASFFGLTLLAGVLVIGEPAAIEKNLENVDAYSRTQQAIIESVKSTPVADNSIPMSNPQVLEGLSKSINEQTIKEIADGFIDSSFNWLNGKNKTIDFEYDISKNKQMFASSTADYAVSRISSLSPCTKFPDTNDVFAVDCYPPGLNLELLRIDINKAIIDDKGLFTNNIISLDSLPKSNNKNITENYPDAPKYFKYFKLSPYILIGISLLAAIIIIFSYKKRRTGIHSVGTSLMGTAIVMAVTPILYIYVLPNIGFKIPSFGSTDQGFSSIVNDSINGLYSQFNIMIINIAVQVAVLAIVLLIIARFMLSKSDLYDNLDKKTGLISSEKKSEIHTKHTIDVPIQTSENIKKVNKKVSNFEKKYRRM